MKLYGYTDSNWAGSVVDKKSTSRCYFNIGSGMISWFCRKQMSVALSTTKAEYIATCGASKEVVWFQKLLAWSFDQELEVTLIY